MNIYKEIQTLKHKYDGNEVALAALQDAYGMFTVFLQELSATLEKKKQLTHNKEVRPMTEAAAYEALDSLILDAPEELKPDAIRLFHAAADSAIRRSPALPGLMQELSVKYGPGSDNLSTLRKLAVAVLDCFAASAPSIAAQLRRA